MGTGRDILVNSNHGQFLDSSQAINILIVNNFRKMRVFFWVFEWEWDLVG